MGASYKKTAGILGGMGPQATVDLMQRIIANTRAEDDRDHIHCLIDNNPSVPSRIKALIDGTGESPGPEMAKMARDLEFAGADFLAIACNTAHHYLKDVQDAVRIPVLDMVALSVREALRFVELGKAQIGILASPAVRITRLYADTLERMGAEALYPDKEYEADLFEIIKAVKRGDIGQKNKDALHEVIRHMQAKGANVCIVACTELGVLMPNQSMRIVDATEVLAQTIVVMSQNAGTF